MNFVRQRFQTLVITSLCLSLLMSLSPTAAWADSGLEPTTPLSCAQISVQFDQAINTAASRVSWFRRRGFKRRLNKFKDRVIKEVQLACPEGCTEPQLVLAVNQAIERTKGEIGGGGTGALTYGVWLSSIAISSVVTVVIYVTVPEGLRQYFLSPWAVISAPIIFALGTPIMGRITDRVTIWQWKNGNRDNLAHASARIESFTETFRRAQASVGTWASQGRSIEQNALAYFKETLLAATSILAVDKNDQSKWEIAASIITQTILDLHDAYPDVKLGTFQEQAWRYFGKHYINKDTWDTFRRLCMAEVEDLRSDALPEKPLWRYYSNLLYTLFRPR